MATPTTEDEVDLDATAKVDSGQPSKESQSKSIKIREVFEIGGIARLIYDISVDESQNRTFGWKIHEGSHVVISGSGLNLFNQIKFNIDGASYLQEDVSVAESGRSLSFYVSNSIKDLYSNGTKIELELADSKNVENNRYLQEKFSYFLNEDKKEDQNKREKEAQEKEKQGENYESNKVLSDLINKSIGGAPEAFAAGFSQNDKPSAPTSSKPVVATRSTSSVASSVGGGAGSVETSSLDLEDDNEIVEQGQNVEAEISSTTKTSSGSATISQGGTVEQDVSGEISGGGAVEQSSSVNISGETNSGGSAGGQINSSTTISASGGGGQGTVTASVSGSGATAGGGASEASAIVQNQGTVSATFSDPTVSPTSQPASPEVSSGVGLSQATQSAPVQQVGSDGTQSSGGGSSTQGSTPASNFNIGGGSTTGKTVNSSQSGSQPNLKQGGADTQTQSVQKADDGEQSQKPASNPTNSEVKPESPKSSGQNQPTQSTPGKGVVDGVSPVGGKQSSPKSKSDAPTPKKAKTAEAERPDKAAPSGGLGILQKLNNRGDALDKKLRGGGGKAGGSLGGGASPSLKADGAQPRVGGRNESAQEKELEGKDIPKGSGRGSLSDRQSKPDNENQPEQNSPTEPKGPQSGLPAQNPNSREREQPEEEPEDQEDDEEGQNEEPEDQPQQPAQKSQNKLGKLLKDSFNNAINKVGSFYLESGVWWLWGFGLLGGVTIIIGAFLGDIVWAFRPKILNTRTKVHIVLMNLASVFILAFYLVLIITIIEGLCKNWISGSFIYSSGYGDICKALDRTFSAAGK